MVIPKKTKEDRVLEKLHRQSIKKASKELKNKLKNKDKNKKPKVKKISAKKEKERLDMIFSIYIRLKGCLDTTNTTEIGKCFTCGRTYTFYELQNGHFISRKSLHTRFDEDNCKIQCSGCNVFKSGNYIEYTTRMIDKHGREFVERLKEKSKELIKFKAHDYVRMQNEIVYKIRELTGFEYVWDKVEGKSYKKWVRK